MLGNVKVRVVVLAALVAAIIVVAVTTCIKTEELTVGFIYDNDEKTPYSYDFYLAQQALQETYGSRINILAYSNILDKDVHATAEKLCRRGCKIIFTNSYGNMLSLAYEHPEVQFCQVSNDPLTSENLPGNYHTFKGEAYEGRYVSGVVAGLKLREMIEKGEVAANDATVGFVAAYPYPEVISGYTAFLMGVRSVVNTATLKVKYTNAWSDYTIEKACATELLDEGCSIISQHTDTVGPAVACEEYYARHVYHVGYNIDMTDVAPNTSLTSARINWSPYLLNAVKATLSGRRIEDVVPGSVHPNNDMSGGLSQGWIELSDPNKKLLPANIDDTIQEVKDEVANGTRQVFYGPYTGVDPTNPQDTIDLSTPFHENESSSIPSFRYVLNDVVTIEE